MVEVISIALSEPIWWRIDKDLPLITNIKIKEYTLVNPRASKLDSSGKHIWKDAFFLEEKNELIFKSYNIFLLEDTDNSKKESLYTEESSQEFISNKVKKITDVLFPFISWIRFFSFQYSMPPIPSLSSFIENDRVLDELLYEEDSTRTKGSVRNDIIERAVSERVIVASALKATNNHTVPIYNQFLLDAYASYKTDNYKLSLLNIVITLESFLALKMSEEYKRRLLGGAGPDIRVIDIQVNKKESIKKDYIYEALSSVTNFSYFLHERPLYLMGRSFMMDDRITYDILMKLYTTRNKIVHIGELNEQSGGLPITEESTEIAFKCVKTVFKWFGEVVEYPSSLDFIPIVFARS